jgi:hypothetical protein
MMKNNPPAALNQNEGDKTGEDCCAELTTGSETGARRDIPHIMVDLEYARDAVPWEAGAELGSSDQTVVVEKLDRGALVKLTNLGTTSKFRNKYGQLRRHFITCHTSYER